MFSTACEKISLTWSDGLEKSKIAVCSADTSLRPQILTSGSQTGTRAFCAKPAAIALGRPPQRKQRRPRRTSMVLCISNRNAHLPPFLTAIRNFVVLCFQRLRLIFNSIHLRLEFSEFYAFSRLRQPLTYGAAVPPSAGRPRPRDMPPLFADGAQAVAGVNAPFRRGAFPVLGITARPAFFQFLKTANGSVREMRFQLWGIRNWNYQYLAGSIGAIGGKGSSGEMQKQARPRRSEQKRRPIKSRPLVSGRQPGAREPPRRRERVTPSVHFAVVTLVAWVCRNKRRRGRREGRLRRLCQRG